MKRNILISILCTLLIVFWVYAAGSKLWYYTAFKIQLSRQPLPEWSMPVLQWLIPMLELLTVALLCFQRTLGKGFLLSFLLMLAFTAYVGLGLAHVYDKVPCSCGGIFGSMGWGSHFIFNIIFTIIAFTGWRLAKTNDEFFIRHNFIMLKNIFCKKSGTIPNTRRKK